MTLTLDFHGQSLKAESQEWQGWLMWSINVILTCNHTYGLDLLLIKLRFKDLLGSDQGDFRCCSAVDSSSYLSMLELI